MLLSYDEFELKQDRLVDHYTDELFDVSFPTVARCSAPVSRFAVDVERFDDHAQESMPRNPGLRLTWASSALAL